MLEKFCVYLFPARKLISCSDFGTSRFGISRVSTSAFRTSGLRDSCIRVLQCLVSPTPGRRNAEKRLTTLYWPLASVYVTTTGDHAPNRSSATGFSIRGIAMQALRRFSVPQYAETRNILAPILLERLFGISSGLRDAGTPSVLCPSICRNPKYPGNPSRTPFRDFAFRTS
jgi:hypothetical protein